jgi:hypothetical protein
MNGKITNDFIPSAVRPEVLEGLTADFSAESGFELATHVTRPPRFFALFSSR